jgi:hypothetical protein
MQGNFNLDLRFCTSEHGFSFDELVIRLSNLLSVSYPLIGVCPCRLNMFVLRNQLFIQYFYIRLSSYRSYRGLSL